MINVNTWGNYILKKTGIRWPMLCFGFGNMPFELIKQNMKTFANEIMPEFQK